MEKVRKARPVVKAWDAGVRPEPRQLGTWTLEMLPLHKTLRADDRLTVENYGARVVAFRGLDQVASSGNFDLYKILHQNWKIAHGIIKGIEGNSVTLELT